MSDGFLQKYFLSNGGKRLHKWMHYFDIYERHFDRFRGTCPTFLEIGVEGGGSLQMWKEYFGPGAKIIGLDINPACKDHETEGVEIFIGSQDDVGVLQSILEKYPDINAILDDGSHVMRHMITTFEYFYPRLNSKGTYLIEDVHTAYLDEYGGGLNRSGTIIEYVKDRLDDLNATYTGGGIPVSPFTRSTQSISVYDSVIAFEKRPQGIRNAPVTAAMSGT